MTQQEIIDYCLSLKDAFKRYPFGESPLVICVLANKGFCDIYEDTEPLHIVVKCEPMEAEFLRSVYSSVKPGYHCNKTHWNSIYLDGTIPDGELKRMIANSYELVKGKPKRRRE